MSDKKKYYWLKLKEDFFEDDTISWLEEQENGKDYCLFYLKLCLKSLKNDGVLIRNVGELFIPYEINKLAELTNTDIDTCIVAMELFKKIGLVQVLENGEIFLTQVQNMVGSETNWAILKRNERLKKLELDNVQKLSTRDRDKSIEKDIEIEKEINKESEGGVVELATYIESNFVRTLSPLEVEKIKDWLDTFDIEMIKYAIDLSILNNKKTFSYISGILKNWKTNGFKNLADVKEEKKEIKKEELPSWVNDPIPQAEITEEDKKEFEDILASFN